MPRRRTSAIETTLNLTGKAATGLFRWAATDHYGLARSFSSMPRMGFLTELKLILIHGLFAVIGAVMSALWLTFLICFVLPYLLFGV